VPTKRPTRRPTRQPTAKPTSAPTSNPPTYQPTALSGIQISNGLFAEDTFGGSKVQKQPLGWITTGTSYVIKTNDRTLGGGAAFEGTQYAGLQYSSSSISQAFTVNDSGSYFIFFAFKSTSPSAALSGSLTLTIGSQGYVPIQGTNNWNQYYTLISGIPGSTITLTATATCPSTRWNCVIFLDNFYIRSVSRATPFAK
jgi:hypothetical protein